MTKLPGKGHDQASLDAAKHAVASKKPDASDKEVDSLADAIQKATDEAVEKFLKAPADDKEADSKSAGASSKK